MSCVKTLVIAKGKLLNSKGITLVELLVTITILGILAAIVIPTLTGLTEKAKVEVCNANLLELDRGYKAYLTLENVEHSDLRFTRFLQNFEGDLCQRECEIAYIDGKVQCSTLPINDENNDNDVPFL
ncbi:type II secretion system protein [Bacillus solitudinis]|uniref:type II secretion system protein n=1 Tax=Bacillus solitudinis TaxID=2014074 RepID=UPI000C23FBD6|nr:prepilin-type N-terminal cleavage/methylation domain-containing protein [Bacillus solitudinis]